MRTMSANVYRCLDRPLAVHCRRPMRDGFACQRDDALSCSQRLCSVRCKRSDRRRLIDSAGPANAQIVISSLTFRRWRRQYGANFQGLCERTKRLEWDTEQSE